MPKLDDQQLFFAQLVGLFLAAIALTVATYKLGDPEFKTFATLAWGGLLTFLNPKKG